MSFSVNPQLIYYLLLFLLTVVLRCIRAYRNRPESDVGIGERKAYWASYTFFGFELVNVSAGVFILVSEHVSNFVGPVMILYVILVIIGFFIEEQKVGIRVRTVGHVAVSAIIVLVTVYAFLKVEGLRGGADGTVGNVAGRSRAWRVAIPYLDASLNRNFGVKFTPVQSVFVSDVQGATRLDAIEAARSKFYSSSGPRPFVEKTEKTPYTMIVLDTGIVAEAKATRR